MKSFMQKTAILSLSLILISTYSVSCVIPELREFFPGYSQESIEMLISISSLAISVTILLNIWLTKIFSERMSIVLGSVFLAAGGAGAMFLKSYEAFFAARILLGFGIGLINARAITIIQNRYEGQEQALLLGLRGSAEVLGNTLLTFLAGRLMVISWRMSFVIYLFILPILAMYLIFIPDGGKQKKAHSGQKERALRMQDEAGNKKKERIQVRPYIPFLVEVFLLGWAFINTNSSATMRIPTLMVEQQLGTAADSSLVLTFMLVVGVISGGLFERMLRVLGKNIFAVGWLAAGIGLLIISVSGNIFLLLLGTAGMGFANGFLATVIFHQIAQLLPPSVLEYGTYAALLGCNIGAATSPMVLKVIGMIRADMRFSYVVYGIASLAIAAVSFVRPIGGRKAAQMPVS